MWRSKKVTNTKAFAAYVGAYLRTHAMRVSASAFAKGITDEVGARPGADPVEVIEASGVKDGSAAIPNVYATFIAATGLEALGRFNAILDEAGRKPLEFEQAASRVAEMVHGALGLGAQPAVDLTLQTLETLSRHTGAVQGVTPPEMRAHADKLDEEDAQVVRLYAEGAVSAELLVDAWADGARTPPDPTDESVEAVYVLAGVFLETPDG